MTQKRMDDLPPSLMEKAIAAGLVVDDNAPTITQHQARLLADRYGVYLMAAFHNAVTDKIKFALHESQRITGIVLVPGLGK